MATAALPLKEFTGTLGSPEHDAWKAESLRLNKKASAKRARWAAYLGRPYRLSPTDPRPDPGTIENDAGLIDG